ncbi:MAG: helix-turn-helix domain-containing protein [Pirellulales bacterium]|nr:helix-turn-helix domain-containing protein [Pirellulales bacterium]
MAKRLVDTEEAARILGKSVEEINSLRDRSKLFPKRDGGEWKYDTDELERYKRDQDDSASSWETDLNDIQLIDENEPDSILLSEAELGESAETTKSTIIGKQKNAQAAADSDIRLAGDSDLRLQGADGPTGGQASDIELLGSGGDLSGLSGLSLADDSKISMGTGSGIGSNIFADELNVDALGSSAPLGSGELKLSSDDEISLGDSPSDRARKNPEFDTTKGDSGLMLSDDDELVLGGSGSDLTLNAADSGIMLVDPADSGLSLEQPLTLGSSGKNKDNLVIGEDDMITLEDDVDVEGATQLRADEDFALTPGGMDDDDSDSGSQVIALDSEEDLSASGAMFSSGDNLLTESPLGMPDALAGGAMPAAGVAMMPVASIPEAPYSVWNILSLLACIVFLLLGGIMVYDLSQSIWSWHGTTAYNSAIMDSLLGMFEGK